MGKLFGQLSPEQLEAVKRHVEGREVFNLGFGPTEVEPLMLRAAGATHVTAIDKYKRSNVLKPRVDVKDWGLAVHAYYEEMTRLPPGMVDINPSVAYLSWPVTSSSHEVPLLRMCDKVIYLGMNRFGTACGGRALWGHLLFRELLEEVQADKNDLLVYGKPLLRARKPQSREEIEAVNNWSYAKG